MGVGWATSRGWRTGASDRVRVLTRPGARCRELRVDCHDSASNEAGEVGTVIPILQMKRLEAQGAYDLPKVTEPPSVTQTAAATTTIWEKISQITHPLVTYCSVSKG